MTAAAFMAKAPHKTGEAELDELTLEQAQRGDDDACRLLVERYQGPVFALIGRMLGTGRQALVEDVAQETFLDVFRALSGFSSLGPARLSTWILTIASRRAIDEIRRQSVPLARAVEVPADVPGPERADADARRRAIAVAIEGAVAELSPEHRAAFLLREYHGFDYAEIAKALGIEAGTVKSRLSRARASLRQALSEVRDE